MTTLESKRIVFRYMDEIQKGNLEIIDELISPAARFYVRGLAPTSGRESQRRWATMLFEAFPGACLVVDDAIAEGGRVAVRWTFSGTHNGPFEGVAPTGKEVTITGLSFYRLADGKIEEGWSSYDLLGAFQQLGVTPPAGLGHDR